MPLKLVRGKNLPIGIDLGSSSIKIAQLRQADTDFELLAADSDTIPQDCRARASDRMDYLTGSLRRMLKTKTFRGRRCVLSLPAEATFVHHLKLPRMKPAQIPKMIRQELQGKLPYDVKDAVVRHVVAGDLPGDGESRQEVIVVCSPRNVLEQYLAMTRKAKLDVVGVNVEPCAVVECFARLFRRATDANRTVLFVDMGAESTQVVFSHGNQIAFARNLRIGGADFDQSVAEGMNISPEQAHELRLDIVSEDANFDPAAADEVYRLFDKPIEALSNELTKCLRYYESVFRNRAIERAIFLGGQAHDTRLCQNLAKRLHLPAQIGDPLVRIKRIDDAGHNAGLDQRKPQPDWAVAIGLSIGAVKAA